MGSIISCVRNNQVLIHLVARVLMSQLGLNFNLDQWHSARYEGDMETHLQNIRSIATDLSQTDKSQIKTQSRCVFICVNTYVASNLTLGVGPMNDGLNVAESMNKREWPIFFIHNPTQAQYLEWLAFFLQNTTTELITYYTGHGTQLDGTDRQEESGKDEAYVFENGSEVECLRDDDLQKCVVKNKTNTNCKCVFLSDCCHSGTIWDLNKSNSPQNCLSISAAADKQTAKQTQVESKEQGIFTYYLFKFLEEDSTYTPNQLKDNMLPYLKKFDQNYTLQTTTPSLVDQSFL